MHAAVDQFEAAAVELADAVTFAEWVANGPRTPVSAKLVRRPVLLDDAVFSVAEVVAALRAMIDSPTPIEEPANPVVHFSEDASHLPVAHS